MKASPVVTLARPDTREKINPYPQTQYSSSFLSAMHYVRSTPFVSIRFSMLYTFAFERERFCIADATAPATGV
jgi:hypothetical protein